jgi:hypothetical protein
MSASLSVYRILIPTVIQKLTALSALLEKAAVHCQTHKIDPAVLLSMRLFPDMYALTKQVQIATDMVKAAGARLAQVEMPSFADNETSIAELQQRIATVQAFLRGLPVEAFEDAADRQIQLSLPNGVVLNFNGIDYVNQWVLPNFYFHMATAYNLLRHNGVALGKRDFLA